MNATDGGSDLELRQFRLSRFGLVLALMGLGFVALTFLLSLWLGQLSHNRSSVPLLVASAAFAALWLLLRGAPGRVDSSAPSNCQRCLSVLQRSHRWR